jgi:hypothetical protein
MHRVDAESAVGALTPFAPAFADDGIDELLVGFFGRPQRGPRVDSDRTLLLRSTDTDDDWFVRMGPAGYQVTHTREDAECTASGSASDLYALIWNRVTPDAVTIDGDRGVLDQWRQAATIRW